MKYNVQMAKQTTPEQYLNVQRQALSMALTNSLSMYIVFIYLSPGLNRLLSSAIHGI